ncbi:tRNA (adenosine(37)-N6)-dimethylallyltransferase MiaA [Maribacter sp. 2210JD10-5]|uniref:tRNA (adenosine(37)-N6)-dimethylallyltransferase MiaA n=1 Tax=Maribacter sp. 2210JD10-5 TaxID=3386272 RepID=UPI0039BD034E
MSKILLSVIGPTAIGKTKLAILLANHFGTEIISADSRQFYEEMKIGTAVPSKEELSQAKHHFIQHKSIKKDYSVGDFEREGIYTLHTLFKKNDVVIMVGGSGLYVDSITKGLDSFPSVDAKIRKSLNRILQNDGIAALQSKLKELDIEYYEKVDLHNPHRLIRALEICIGTGKPYSSFLNQPRPDRKFKVLSIGLQAERKILYDRINQRVDLMISEGLLKEVTELVPFKEYNALQTVGYKELFKYLDKEIELDFAISEIKKNTRRFAKRQLTWFKKTKDVLWLNYDYEKQTAIELIEKKISSLGNT